VSRDLAELGLVKSGGRYVPGGTAAPAAVQADPIAAFVRSASPAGPNIVVLRCETGSAPRVGLALDQQAWPGIVGTIAGDDTVFVAAASAADAARLIRLIQARLPRTR
jgi:transcriptional regulator of arginine metabolism